MTGQRAAPAEASPAPAGLLSVLLRTGAVLLPLTGILWLFHLYARVLPGWALIACWALCALLIARALFWRSRVHRRLVLRAWLVPASPLVRHLRGGWLMAARQGALASLLAAVLLIGLARTGDPFAWAVLVLNVLLLPIVLFWTRHMLTGHANPVALPVLGWRCAQGIVGLLLTGALVYLALDRQYPDFSQVSLEQAAWHLIDREHARSGAAETLLRMAAAKDGVRLWLAQQLMPHPGTSLLQLVGWAMVLLEQVLFVWSHLLLCNALLIGVWRDEHPGEHAVDGKPG